MKAQVSIRRCGSYDLDELLPAMDGVLEASSFPSVEGKTVLVKPNILSDSLPETCITTHPQFLRAFLRLLKARKASTILVGDSPNLAPASFSPANCGIAQVCREEGAVWVDFAQDPVTTRIPYTRLALPLAAAALKADLLVSLPKLKTHRFLYFTGGVKNLFGLVPGRRKSACHLAFPTRDSFSDFLAGLLKAARPGFCLMDGILGMEGPGPSNGRPRAVGLVLGSRDCAALDLAMCQTIGYEASRMPLLRALARRGLLPEKIVYPDLTPEEAAPLGFERIAPAAEAGASRLSLLPFQPRRSVLRRQRREAAPVFDPVLCVRCLRCVRICPAGALAPGEGRILLDLSRCIRCYCCQEVCPVGAVAVPGANNTNVKKERPQ